MRVIIVDDDADVRLLVRLTLEQANIEVVGEASNGADGLLLINQLHPDVAILDLMMPGMDGFDTWKAVPPAVDVIIFSNITESVNGDKRSFTRESYHPTLIVPKMDVASLPLLLKFLEPHTAYPAEQENLRVIRRFASRKQEWLRQWRTNRLLDQDAIVP